MSEQSLGHPDFILHPLCHYPSLDWNIRYHLRLLLLLMSLNNVVKSFDYMIRFRLTHSSKSASQRY